MRRKTDDISKPLITLVGIRQAKQGFTFIHKGSSPHCVPCEYRKVCIENLKPNRVYRVVGLREKVLPCDVHDSGARVVEVIESDIRTTLSTKLAIEGAITTFEPQDCDIQICENYRLCVPRGLLKGDKCVILKTERRIECQKRLSLIKATLHQLPVS